MSLLKIKRAAPATVSCDLHPGGAVLGRRGFLSSCGCATLAISAAGLGLLAAADRAEAQAGGKPLRVGHLPAGCVSHVLLAKQRNLFAAAGLNVQLTQFNGPGENLQALVAGSLDACHNPWTMAMAAYGEGTRDLRIVGGSGQAGIELVARKGSVKTVEEFIAAAGKGLRVGTLKLDTLELVGYGTMSRHGKSYNDYKMTFFPSMVGMAEALFNAAVDVCTLAQPYAETVVRQADGVYLTDSNSVWGPEAPDCVITTTTKSLQANSATLNAYMKVLQASAKAMAQDYDAAIADLAPVYGAPKPILAAALKRQAPNPVIGPAGVNGIRNGMKFLMELGYFKENFADKVLDLQFQPAA